MHLENVNTEKFIKKALEINSYLSKQIAINAVAVKEQLKDSEQIGNIIRNPGLKFNLQPNKTNKMNDYKKYYSKGEKKLIQKFSRYFS